MNPIFSCSGVGALSKTAPQQRIAPRRSEACPETGRNVQIGTALAAACLRQSLPMTKPPTPPQDNSANDTAAQAGIEKTLSDELNKGLTFAARSVGALDEQERQNLLSEAEIAYQNAIYLSEQSTTPPESPISKQLQQLGAFLVKNIDTEEGN
jgi:uncharacterized membrane protein YebE (DUF533 family)